MLRGVEKQRNKLLKQMAVVDFCGIATEFCKCPSAQNLADVQQAAQDLYDKQRVLDLVAMGGRPEGGTTL